MRKKAAPHNNRIHFVLFVCVLCTMWCFVWFLHEMVLLLHENLNYCTKRIWYLCKLQNKNFSMVCCTTLWWDGAGKGRGWKTAAIIYCWQQQHVRGRTAQLSDISSGATCVADLDSGALALTKEASGNSRGLVIFCFCFLLLFFPSPQLISDVHKMKCYHAGACMTISCYSILSLSYPQTQSVYIIIHIHKTAGHI